MLVKAARKEIRRSHGGVYKQLPVLLALLILACGEAPADKCSGYNEDHGSEAGATSDPTSCAAEGPGLTDCGDEMENCCQSPLVPGGSFSRTYTNEDGCSPRDEADHSTVSSFRLDKYAVTVGRFRQFVDAWNGGWRPEPGSGKHSYLNGGDGLNANKPKGGYEPGWLPLDNSSVSLTTKALTSCSGSNLTDDYRRIPYSCNTWTDAPDAGERLPIVCVNWPEAYAFCIWDGGFLPSDAELEYAAAGGDEQRKFPWGPAAPGQESQYAIFECDFPTPSVCTSAAKIAPVGTAKLGVGRWGQLDLVGNVRQIDLDGMVVTHCEDCTDLSRDSTAIRGGGFASTGSQLSPAYYYGLDAEERRFDAGIRCARAP